MSQPDDIELLRQFAEQDSEEAFATLVTRYLNLVYSSALRHVSNPDEAEEIAQAVFIILARKARHLRAGTILSGWLYHTSRLTALNFLRTERRRARREQEAQMQSLVNESGHADDAWPQIAPMLDDAMASLNQSDRNAIVLRFFENRSMEEIGTALRVPEATGRKRVTRAVERLRIFFSKRGVTLSAVAIAGAVSANSVHAAPAGLAVSVGAAAAKGTVLAASITTLVNGTMKIMTWIKLKFALGLGVAAVLTGAAVTVAVSQAGNSNDHSALQAIAKEALDTYAALSSYSSTGKVVQESAGQTGTTTFSIRLQRPNLYRVDWSQTTGPLTSKGVVWSAGDGDYCLIEPAGQKSNATPQKMRDMQMALASATGVSGTAAAVIPGTFFGQNWGDVLKVPASGYSQLKKGNDETVGGVDCYVVSSTVDPSKFPAPAKARTAGGSGTTTTTLWIGKQDHLIHQTRTSMSGMSVTLPDLSDSDLKTILERQNKPATPEAIAALRAELTKANQRAQDALKSGKYVSTQTHENISVNQPFSPSDFAN
jgi:RNA polymerase sigma factor (sigma-70 family)